MARRIRGNIHEKNSACGCFCMPCRGLCPFLNRLRRGGGADLGTNGTANALVARPNEDITYQNASTEAGTAYYTGKTIDASVEDTRYGGPQFVSKLFTEGVSRAPEAEEYVEYTGILEEKGCTVETLSSLAETFFSSETFQNEKLNNREKTFAVYRAILSREPSEEELSEHENTDAARTGERAVRVGGILPVCCRISTRGLITGTATMPRSIPAAMS